MTSETLPLLVIDDKIPFIQGEAERLGRCRYLPGAAISAADVHDADILVVRTRTRCDAQLLEGSRVRHIVTATIGFDHLDTAYLAQRGITWTNCPGCNAKSVAQYVYCSLLQLENAGILAPRATVGIVGVGHVGTAVADLLTRKGYRLLLHDPLRAETGWTAHCDREQLMAEADVLTFHTPLTHEGKYATYHMANADWWEGCQRQPVVINSARGGVIAEPSLLTALHSGKVRAAVIDTWEHEPHPDADLLRAAFIATPHIAGYSADGKATATRMALTAAARFLGSEAVFDIVPPPFPCDRQYHPCHPSAQEALRYYDPLADTVALKNFPQLFEQFRGNYPLRREND